MFKKGSVTLGDKQKLSESVLWNAQTQFYAKQGINAWINQVPYYITSNPFIADTYARICLRYLQDNQANLDITQPIYILELGTGSGKFSFYFLRSLQKLQRSLQLEHLNICYVMSDFTTKNIEFWQSHEAFSDLIAKGQLDFCQLDIESDASPRLLQSDSPLKTDNPLITFVNYLFDSTRADAFYVDNQQLHETLATVKCPKSNLKQQQPIDLEKLELEFTQRPITLPYYDDPARDSILSYYTEHLEDRSGFLLPTTAINLLNTLQQVVSSNKLLLLSTDKGYSHIAEQYAEARPHIAFHNSFSLMVNFDAIGRYINAKDGCYLSQQQHEGIQTCAFILGDREDDLPETLTAFEQSANQFGTASYFSLHQALMKQLDGMDLATITHYLKLSHWDPYVFVRVARRINSLLPKADRGLQQCLISGVKEVAAQFYFMPDDSDPMFEVGLFFHTLEDYSAAIPYYQQSLTYRGRNYWSLYNIGLCYNFIGQPNKALTWFEQALPKMPDKTECQKHIDQIKRDAGKD